MSDAAMRDLTELEHLLSAYFHEDFDGIGPTLDLYFSETTSDDVTTLVSDLDALILESAQPGVDMRARLWGLGSYVYLGEENAAYVEWVREVRRRCVAHLEL